MPAYATTTRDPVDVRTIDVVLHRTRIEMRGRLGVRDPVGKVGAEACRSDHLGEELVNDACERRPRGS